ncbi:MAG: hypothetical protein HQK54_14945 [Oligoflexales bacterium]|nr:hypothetical protein [Oligoflexales bacterium]
MNLIFKPFLAITIIVSLTSCMKKNPSGEASSSISSGADEAADQINAITGALDFYEVKYAVKSYTPLRLFIGKENFIPFLDRMTPYVLQKLDFQDTCEIKDISVSNLQYGLVREGMTVNFNFRAKVRPCGEMGKKDRPLLWWTPFKGYVKTIYKISINDWIIDANLSSTHVDAPNKILGPLYKWLQKSMTKPIESRIKPVLSKISGTSLKKRLLEDPTLSPLVSDITTFDVETSEEGLTLTLSPKNPQDWPEELISAQNPGENQTGR